MIFRNFKLSHKTKNIISYQIVTHKSGCEYICSNSFRSFFSNEKHKNYINWTSFDILTALDFLLDKFFVHFGVTVYRKVIGISMRTNCATLIVDIFLYWYESQFMARINKDSSKQHLVEKFNNTFRYLDNILALNNDDCNSFTKDKYPVFWTKQILTINIGCPFLDLSILIHNGKFNTKICDKRDDFIVPIDGDVRLSLSYVFLYHKWFDLLVLVTMFRI